MPEPTSCPRLVAVGERIATVDSRPVHLQSLELGPGECSSLVVALPGP